MQTEANGGKAMNTQRRRVAALVSADLAALLCLRPHAHALGARLAHPQAWVSRVGADAALATVAGAALWCAAAWLAAGLLAATLGRLPGAIGRGSQTVADHVVPRVLRRLIAGSAGVGILLAPGSVAGAVGAPAGPPAGAVTAAALPTPGWPVDPTPAPLPAPDWPAQAPPETHGADTIRVRPGDSLWLIAARRLGPHPAAAAVASKWPRWYAANRDVIGPDPSVIHPGQRLHAPDARHLR